MKEKQNFFLLLGWILTGVFFLFSLCTSPLMGDACASDTNDVFRCKLDVHNAHSSSMAVLTSSQGRKLSEIKIRKKKNYN